MHHLIALFLSFIFVLSHQGMGVGHADQRPADERPFTIFAAASMGDVIRDLAALSGQADKVRLSLAGTSVLARQIDAGAPADLFISANRQWVEYLEGRDVIVADSARIIAGNKLVMVAPATAPSSRGNLAALIETLGDNQRLAIADPNHVPAGQYAKQALSAVGAWTRVEQRLAIADNVRAVLALVARGEAPLGIVYASDARAEPGVAIVHRFRADSHDPITYMAVAVPGGRQAAAARFITLMLSAAGQAILLKHGFETRAP